MFEWSRILQTYGYSPRYYYLEHEGEIKSIFPCAKTKKGIVSLPFVDYITLDSVEIAKKVWSSCRAEGSSFEHYSTTEYYFDKLSSKRFASSFVLDISKGMDDVWKNSFTKKMRNQIRKAQKASVNVKLVDNPQDLVNEYYDLYLKTMKRIGALPHTKNFLEKVISELYQHVRLFSASRAEKSIGFLLSFVYNGHLHIWGNVSDPKFLWAAPNNLLYYAAIKHGVEQDLYKIDFGSTPEGSGHAHFKDSFGGELVPIYRISDNIHEIKNQPTIARIVASMPYPVSQRLIKYIFTKFS